MAQDTKTPAKTGIEIAREAAAKYGNITLQAKFLKLNRRAGGSTLFLFTVNGTPEALAAYKEVMQQVKLPNDANGNPRTAYVEDQITGKPLFFLPTTRSKSFELAWTSGNPDVNPLGRFVQNDVEAIFDREIRQDDLIMQERAKLLALRSLGLAPSLNEPRGRGNQSTQSQLSDAEIEEAMRKQSANPDAQV